MFVILKDGMKYSHKLVTMEYFGHNRTRDALADVPGLQKRMAGGGWVEEA